MPGLNSIVWLRRTFRACAEARSAHADRVLAQAERSSAHIVFVGINIAHIHRTGFNPD